MKTQAPSCFPVAFIPFRFLPLFLSIFFLLASCGEELSNESFSLQSITIDCTVTPSPINGALIRQETREELFTVHHLYYHGEVHNMEELAEYYAAINPMITSSLGIEAEIDYFHNTTPLNYLGEKLANGTISTPYHSYMQNFISALENYFTEAQSPTEIEAVQFFTQQVSLIENNSDLCAAEKARLKMMNYTLQGYAEFLYTFMPTSVALNGPASFRECEFDWQTFLCFLIEAGVITAAAAIAGNPVLGVIGGSIYLGVAIITTLLTDGDFKPTKACCSIFNTPVPDCNPVENIHAYVEDCNDFQLRAFGSGEDIVSWRWANINTMPSEAVTTLPSLKVSVPNQTGVSTINVFAVCEDGSEAKIHKEEWDLTSLQDAPPPTNWWAIAPPNSASVSSTNKHEVACVVGSSDHIEVSWSVSYGGGVTQDPNHSYQAEVVFWAAGEVTISIKTKNICTGETHTLSKKVNVN